MHDALCREIISKNINMAVPWYLMAAYAYYHLDENIISDALYDELYSKIDMFWDFITHWHKNFIPRDEGYTSSAYTIPEWMYPSIIKNASERLLSHVH